ncbi:hypothetical protein HYFRA_00003249 [Hymenoscyphus fraxineus]|uniref:Rhodopsin domain-containing protein n=1 Tax=Hymenoscyphus fraxineus TaxID=746836 RepID=A0A9N9KVU5_9HELO|nr:hypothetical protein HYFRA_00003249 [Hymenoscyphus fraxineus]
MIFPNKSQGTSLGLGKHVAVVQMESPNTVTTIFHTLVPAEFSYATSILFTKYSILAFYWRIFSVRSMMIAVRIMLAITTLWLIGGGTAALLSCVPLQKLWNPAVPGTCIKTRTLYIGAAIPNVITDFVILIMPLPYVWHLKISRQKRIGLSLTFIFGGLICVISFIRLVFVFKLDMEEDLTWNFIDTLIWTAVETFGGIICACLPMLRPLFIKPSNRPTSSASSSKDSRFSGPRSPFRAEHADGPTRTGTFGTVGKTQGQGSWTPKTTAYEMEGDIPLDGPRDVVMNVGMELKERER